MFSGAARHSQIIHFLVQFMCISTVILLPDLICAGIFRLSVSGLTGQMQRAA